MNKPNNLKLIQNNINNEAIKGNEFIIAKYEAMNAECKEIIESNEIEIEKLNVERARERARLAQNQGQQ